MPVIEQQKPAAIEQETTEARTTPAPRAPSPPSKGPSAIVLTGILLAVALVVVAIVFIAGGGDKAGTPVRAPAPAATPAPVAAASIGVTLKEFTVSPVPATGRAGRVTFRVSNAGAVGHEFVVLRTSTSAARLLKGDEASEAGNVGEIGDLQPGVTKTLKLNLKPGHYALICNLPGHYAAGQRADFVVK